MVSVIIIIPCWFQLRSTPWLFPNQGLGMRNTDGILPLSCNAHSLTPTPERFPSVFLPHSEEHRVTLTPCFPGLALVRPWSCPLLALPGGLTTLPADKLQLWPACGAWSLRAQPSGTGVYSGRPLSVFPLALTRWVALTDSEDSGSHMVLRFS